MIGLIVPGNARFYKRLGIAALGKRKLVPV
jgi:hypothetical protein